MPWKKKPNRLGRPPKAPGDALSETIRVRVRPGERRSIELKAKAKGMNLSTWARWKLLYGK